MVPGIITWGGGYTPRGWSVSSQCPQTPGGKGWGGQNGLCPNRWQHGRRGIGWPAGSPLLIPLSVPNTELRVQVSHFPSHVPEGETSTGPHQAHPILPCDLSPGPPAGPCSEQLIWEQGLWLQRMEPRRTEKRALSGLSPSAHFSLGSPPPPPHPGLWGRGGNCFQGKG